MLAKLTMECLIEEERGEDILLQGIVLIMLEDNYGIFMNRFVVFCFKRTKLGIKF